MPRDRLRGGLLLCASYSFDFSAIIPMAADQTGAEPAGHFVGGTDGYGLVTAFNFASAEPVRGSLAGAGLPGFIVAFGGLLAWHRRRHT